MPWRHTGATGSTGVHWPYTGSSGTMPFTSEFEGSLKPSSKAVSKAVHKGGVGDDGKAPRRQYSGGVQSRRDGGVNLVTRWPRIPNPELKSILVRFQIREKRVSKARRRTRTGTMN